MSISRINGKSSRSEAAKKAWITIRAKRALQSPQVAPKAKSAPRPIDSTLQDKVLSTLFLREPTGPAKLVEKYRPITLAEVIGQEAIIHQLQCFTEQPYACAFLFSGESGCGKTSAAMALARDLGCDVESDTIGGYTEIASGEMSADAVRRQVDHLGFRPMFGSGWKVMVANECDRMARPAETIWLDVLEHLPPRTVIVFTTNEPGRLSRRFRDRCESYQFDSSEENLRPWIHALVKRVWSLEVGGKLPDGWERIGMPTLGDPDTMYASFRLALQQLQPLVNSARKGRA